MLLNCDQHRNSLKNAVVEKGHVRGKEQGGEREKDEHRFDSPEERMMI